VTPENFPKMLHFQFALDPVYILIYFRIYCWISFNSTRGTSIAYNSVKYLKGSNYPLTYVKHEPQYFNHTQNSSPSLLTNFINGPPESLKIKHYLVSKKKFLNLTLPFTAILIIISTCTYLIVAQFSTFRSKNLITFFIFYNIK